MEDRDKKIATLMQQLEFELVLWLQEETEMDASKREAVEVTALVIMENRRLFLQK